MLRQITLGVIVLSTFASTANATITHQLWDDFDDRELVSKFFEEAPVQEFRKKLDEFKKQLLKLEERQIEELLGQPAEMPRKTYALPVAGWRGYTVSGLRYADEKLNKNHMEFYPIKDFAGVYIDYGIDGKTPQAVILYFKVNKTFPKLTESNLKERLAWDCERFRGCARSHQAA